MTTPLRETAGRADTGVVSSATTIALCGAAILMASLMNFLRFNDYPLLTPEVGLVLLALCAAAAVVGLLSAMGGRVGRAAAEGLLVFLAVDLNFDRWSIAVALGAAAAILALIRGRSLLPFLAVTALITTLVGMAGIGGQATPSRPASAKASPPARSDAPVLLHLIMDEHAGVAGLPADNPETPAMAKLLTDFYVDRGFRLHGRAYNSYFNTTNALPYLLGAPVQPGAGAQVSTASPGWNRYFAALKASGFRLHVYQSSYIDLCSDVPVEACSEYPESGVQAVATAPLATREKAGIILNQLASLSEGVKRTETNYNRASRWLRARGVEAPPIELDAARRTSTLNALGMFDRLIGDLRRARPGEAYVAHILLPHYPYVTTADCRLKPVSEWQVRRGPAPRRDRERRYFEQMRCATAKIDAALRALSAAPGGRRAIVVVHGDHGSRIMDREPWVARRDRISDRDLIAGYATLLAIRPPSVAAGYDPTVVSVRTALARLARADFGPPPARSEPAASVIIPGGRPGTDPRAPLPPTW